MPLHSKPLQLPNELWDIIFSYMAAKDYHHVRNIILTNSHFYRIAIQYLYRKLVYKTPAQFEHNLQLWNRISSTSTSGSQRLQLPQSMYSRPHHITFVAFKTSGVFGVYRHWRWEKLNTTDWTYDFDKIIPFLRTLTKLHTVKFRGTDIPSTSFANLDTVPGLEHLVLSNVTEILPTHRTDLVFNNARLTSLSIVRSETSADTLCSLLSLPTLRVLGLEWDSKTAGAISTWIRGSAIEQESQLHDVVSETGHRELAPLEEIRLRITRNTNYDIDAVVNCNLWLFLRACSKSLQSIYAYDNDDLFLYGPPVTFPKLHTFVGTSRLGDMFGTMIFRDNSSLRELKFIDEPYDKVLARVFGYTDFCRQVQPRPQPYALRILEIINLDEFASWCEIPHFLVDMCPDLEEFYCGPSTLLSWEEDFLKNLGKTHLSRMPKLCRFVIHPCNKCEEEWDADIGSLIEEWGRSAPALRTASLTKQYEWERTSSDAEWVKWELD